MHPSTDCTSATTVSTGFALASQHPAPLAPIQSPSTAGIDHNGHHLHYLFSL